MLHYFHTIAHITNTHGEKRERLWVHAGKRNNNERFSIALSLYCVFVFIALKTSAQRRKQRERWLL